MATPKPRARNVADLKSSILNPSLTSTYECHFNPPPSVKRWMNRSSLGGGYNFNKDEIKFVSYSNKLKPEIETIHKKLNVKKARGRKVKQEKDW